MAELNVNPADLVWVADAYTELAARAALICPQAAAEAQRVAETHGPMGYPAAVGIAAGLAMREGPMQAKVADFHTYSQRFTEHAAAYTNADKRAAAAIRALVFPANPLPQIHIEPTPPPPPRPSAPVCWIGTENGDVAKLCPPHTDTVTYVDKDGNYVSKDLQTGEVTTMYRPGPSDQYPTLCWLPSADADRSICGPGTNTWMFPHNGFLITEELGPDGKIHIKFQTPLGPLIP
jgi:Excreted virulence factor EspC, type VII ESX diderm